MKTYKNNNNNDKKYGNHKLNDKAEKHKEKFYFLLGEHNTGLAQKFIVQKYRNTSNLLLFN